MNAKDALPHGGTIDIIAARCVKKGSPITIASQLKFATMAAEMDAQTLKRIFEPFFTTKSEGTGLGMPIVARFIERAGGTVEIESKLNVGTTVRLTIPLVGH